MEDDAATLSAEAPARPTSLWRNRDYLLLWSGQLLSQAGTGVSQFAFPLIALFVTGSRCKWG